MTGKAQRKCPIGFRLLQAALRSFFRVFYLLEVHGAEHVPPSGPVIIAANHVNPFDAIIIGACTPRRVRFIVWNRTFNKPAFRWIMTAVGCIPINRDRPDTTAFKEALRWLAGGQLLGIFPEGRYTETGHLHELKPGTLRIALAAGAAVVPATLTGAYRAWPLRGFNSRLFPRPWKIALRFQPPLDLPDTDTAAISEQRTAATRLTADLAAAINSALEPAIRAEDKVAALVARPAPHVRIYEWFLAMVLLVIRDPWAMVVAGLYLVYLLIDIYLIRPSTPTRALRNFAPVLVFGVAYPVLLRLVGPTPHGLWLAASALGLVYGLWALIRYYFDRYYHFQRFVRGLLLTLYLGLLALLWVPDLPHPSLLVGLSLYALAFDFAHARRRCVTFGTALAVLLVAAAALTRYPITAFAVNVATVVVVFTYLHLFKMRAHDGRRI
ncbi:1-acyl-sn-glycerol-3-phosphate acyltransferase [bacterium]|nr:1-acyl-sn-glycerol-3-phosphate acyltransferase [bacterium]